MTMNRLAGGVTVEQHTLSDLLRRKQIEPHDVRHIADVCGVDAHLIKTWLGRCAKPPSRHLYTLLTELARLPDAVEGAERRRFAC